MKVVAVIPCLNEELFIGDVIEKTKKYVDRVVVADDCSEDGTCIIAKRCGADVCGNGVWHGFGGNLMIGINYALTTGDEDILVTLDGDGQHNPEEIPRLVEVIRKGEAEVVIGSRFLDEYDCPTYRKIGIDIITWLYNLGNRNKVTDAQSCMRAYWRGVFDDVKMEDEGFGFSTEILIKVRKCGYKIKEVPISCIYHEHFHHNSSLNPIKHGVGVALATIIWRIKSMVK